MNLNGSVETLLSNGFPTEYFQCHCKRYIGINAYAGLEKTILMVFSTLPNLVSNLLYGVLLKCAYWTVSDLVPNSD